MKKIKCALIGPGNIGTDLLAKLQRPPKVKFNDLAAIGESDLPKASFDVLSAGLNINLLRVTETAVLTSFTVQMENQDLVYKEVGGLPQAAIPITEGQWAIAVAFADAEGNISDFAVMMRFFDFTAPLAPTNLRIL